VAAIVGRAAGYHDHVSEPSRDLLVAPRTAVRLCCLIGLHATDIEPLIDIFGKLVVGHVAVAVSAEEGPGEQGGNDDERRNDDCEVALVLDARSERVVAHGDTVLA
jgi:hypothetical protein